MSIYIPTSKNIPAKRTTTGITLPRAAELVARAVDAGVGVAPLSACDLTPPPPGRPPALILGYTRIAAVDMAPALRRLKAAWAF